MSEASLTQKDEKAPLATTPEFTDIAPQTRPGERASLIISMLMIV